LKKLNFIGFATLDDFSKFLSVFCMLHLEKCKKSVKIWGKLAFNPKINLLGEFLKLGFLVVVIIPDPSLS